MDDSTTVLAAAIGRRVKHERQASSLTLDQLAIRAGVSRRLLINVEQGATNPSVGALLRISDALGVGLPALVESPTPKPVTITRSGEGAALWSSEAGGRGILVAGTESPDVVELWEWIMVPGDRHESEAHSAGTRELLQVQQGEITVEVGDESIVLGPGDALSFPGDTAHSYASAASEPARFTMAVFEPGVGLKRGAR
ncbi:helix-turn-helix domain-containing protein [Arthrobacter sp. CAN_A1]|uniref:helix-turn-helix domain-containing protein n=1 Tax=Arthrobacter sp. CAN_A1 TaxID=2787717 RepID=UPI0018CA9727